MERATTPHPRPQLLIVSYFNSKGRVNNTGVMRITICCHVDCFVIESCHNGFKVMYMHMVIFLRSGLLQFTVNKFFMFCKFFSGTKYGGLQE